MRKLVRMLLPMPAWVIANMACLYFGWDFVQWQTLRRLHIEETPQLLEAFRQPQGAILVGFCIVAGMWRIVAHHPAYHAGYRKWLTTTPWTAKVPLPFGSMMVTWQDGLFLLAAMWLAHSHSRPSPTQLLCAFGITYAVVAAFSLLATKRPNEAFVLAAGLAAMVPAWSHPLGAIGIAACLCAFACVALHRSLAGFPWETGKFLTIGARPAAPMDRLGPLPVEQRLSWREALMLASLGGLWTFVIAQASQMAGIERSEIMVIAECSALVGLIRFVVYISGGHLPPISLLGRIATGRIMIPGFDKILLAPACGFALSIVTPIALSRLGLTGPVCLATTVGLVLAANLGLGPDLNAWRLTGAHRIRLSGPSEPRDIRRGRGARLNSGAS
jgi:hypothetical protein